MTKKKTQAARPQAKSRHRSQQKWSAADRLAAFRTFVDCDSLRETSRRTGVPFGTLAGWLDDPQHAADLERIRTSHARAIAEDDHRLAREAAAGLSEGVAACRARLRGEGEDGKGVAALTRALLHTTVELDRRSRLSGGGVTDRIELVGAELEANDAELRGLLAKPHVRKALARLGKG